MKSLFAALVSLAATAALAHHVPVEPPLPPLSELPAGASGWYSPQPLDQSMYPALHMDSTYAYYATADSLRPYYIALTRTEGVLRAHRIVGWGGWQRNVEEDPSFRIRARANMRFSERVSDGVFKDIYAYIYPVIGGGTYQNPGLCHDNRSKDRMLILLTYQTGEARSSTSGEYFLSPDFWPYYPELGWTAKADIVGVITGHDEHYPWHFAKHHTDYGDDANSCGWTLPSWYRLDEEEHDVPSLHLPARSTAGGAAEQAKQAAETARLNGIRPVPWRPTMPH